MSECINFSTDIDAAFCSKDGYIYWLKDDQYIRFKKDRVDDHFVFDKQGLIADGWTNVPTTPVDFTKDLDAALCSEEGYIYWFKGDQYIRFKKDRVDERFVFDKQDSVADGWTNVPTTPVDFTKNLDAAVYAKDDGGYIYWFKSDQYIRLREQKLFKPDEDSRDI